MVVYHERNAERSKQHNNYHILQIMTSELILRLLTDLELDRD